MRRSILLLAVTWLLPAAGIAQTGMGESGVCDEGCGSCPTDCLSGCLGDPILRFWVRGDYLMWWTKGMSVPPLVTTSLPGTQEEDAGVLGREGTEVLFGDERLFGRTRGGARLRIGSWLDGCGRYGVEGEYFALGDESGRFRRESIAGDPILARPFFNVLSDEQDAELIGYPGVIEGTVTVATRTALESAGVRARIAWRRMGGCCPSDCRARIDLLAGYRFLRLDEGLMVGEDLTSLDPIAPSTFDITDRFDAENTFHGGEIGVLLEGQRCRWSWEILAKLALGNSRRAVRIDGATTITTYGVPDDYLGGILAQRTNIGEHASDDFAVVPEVGVTLGYQLTCRLRATFGYSFIYWSQVARPGDQIDRELNPNLFPREQVPFSGPSRPRFVFQDADFWAQGLNFGLDYRW